MKRILHSLIRRSAITCTALALIVAAGCSGAANEYDATVTGKVTVDGELAKSGTVTFHPVGDDGKAAIGLIHPDGSYSLRTGQGDLDEVDGGTVVSGDYIITVSVTGPPVDDVKFAEGGPPTPGPSLVATKYASKETSDLKRTVDPGGQVVNLELEAAEIVESSDEAADSEGSDETAEAEPAAPPAEPTTDPATPPTEQSPSTEPAEQTPPPAAAPESTPPTDGAASKNTSAPGPSAEEKAP